MQTLPVIAAVLCLAASGCDAAASSEASSSNEPSETVSAASASELSFLVQPDMTAVDARLAVADGFDAEDSWFVVSDDNDAFLGLWTADQVDRDACLVPDDDLVTPGPTVQDLADALTAQEATSSSEPEEVTLAEHDGIYLELTGPPDLTRCDERPGLSDERGIYLDNQVDQLWILDVDGQRLIVDASYGPTATSTERDALTSMVQSLSF